MPLGIPSAARPFFPAAELSARHERLRAELERLELDGALFHGVTHLLYYAGTAQQAHLWVPREGEPRLLVRRVVERARRESALARLEPMRSLRELPDVVGDARRIGMELDILPVSLFERYRRALGERDVVDVGPAGRRLRAVKSELEIDRIRVAASAADEVFREVREALEPGMRELDLSIVVESAERRHGFQGMIRWRAAVGFECPWAHVLAGESALAFSFADTPFGGEGVTPAAPYAAGHRVITRGMPVCLDFAMAVDGYIHDMTRTLSIGPLEESLVAAYEACAEIHQVLGEAGRPGVESQELWAIARRVAEDAGHGERFMGVGAERAGFVGHGIGLELDELPVLAPRQEMPLEAGQVIAVEPKIFFPGVGAVGLEETYVVRHGGLERLTVSDPSLAVV